MAAPVDAPWAKTNATDAVLNLVTYGQGTSFPSVWTPSRLFFRTDLKLLYTNVNTLNSPVFEKVGDAMYFGDASDGDAVISVNTDLAGSNHKQYNNLTINAGIVLSGDTNMTIRVAGTLTFGSATSEISVTGKGTAGGAGGPTAGAGGAGGGQVRVYAKTIVGTGLITADGAVGGTGGGAGTGAGGNGINGTNDNTVETNSNGKGAAASGGSGSGGGGGASIGVGGGGAGPAGGAAGAIFTLYSFFSRFFGTFSGAGGGGGSSDGATGGGGGGGGAGLAFLLCESAIPAMTIRANGGSGGGGGAAGGAGGGGWVVVASLVAIAASLTATGGKTRKIEFF